MREMVDALADSDPVTIRNAARRLKFMSSSLQSYADRLEGK